MSNRFSFSFVYLFVIVLLCASVASASSFYSGDELSIRSEHKGNIYSVSSFLNISAPVFGDASVLAAQTGIFAPVFGDVLAAAGQVIISAPIYGDVRALGAVIDIAGNVSGDVFAKGSTVSVSGPVGGDVFLSGNVVEVGDVSGNANIEAQVVVINGTLAKNAAIRAQELIFTSRGKVIGNVNYTAQQKINDSKVAGSIIFVPDPADNPFSNLGALISSFAAALLIGLVLLWIIPLHTNGIVSNISQRPSWSILRGLLFFFLVPSFCVLLLITIIGIPVAIILAALFVIFLYVGKIFVALAIGRKLVNGDSLALFVGLALYYLVQLMPGFDFMIKSLAALAALGSLSYFFWKPNLDLAKRAKRKR